MEVDRKKDSSLHKNLLLSLFMHLRVVLNLYDFSVHLQSIATKDLKLQKGHKCVLKVLEYLLNIYRYTIVQKFGVGKLREINQNSLAIHYCCDRIIESVS